MPTPPCTTADWKARLAPALDESVEAASRVMTNAPDVQSWLHTASFESAMGLEMQSDLQAAAMAYGAMLDDLHDTFGPLVEAVRELTDGCGTLDLHWRPLSPQFSTLRIAFGTDYDVRVFHRIEADLVTPEVARTALQHVARALPKGDPFPNRPNEATGMLSHDRHCLGVRVREHAADGGRRRTVTLLPPQHEPLERLSEAEAARAIAQWFQRDAPDV
ncbi:MAG: hypothetical protein GVY18_15645 [Bacteroidetes bacterium]|jgi:hypothetical protein|nr:hypothetical protein [Bacteroidota bacterium]